MRFAVGWERGGAAAAAKEEEEEEEGRRCWRGGGRITEAMAGF